VLWDITPGPDGNLWFTQQDNNRVGKITTSGHFGAQYSLPTGSNPWSITTGPDGNLWFIEQGSNKIGKISTGGSISEYVIPTTNGIDATPWNITAGHDGNVWFTESATNKIAKITAGGSITEYVIPTPNSFPVGITSGPDGNLWFTESSGNKIGRITSNGIFTEYAVPTLGSSPLYITAGHDGNIWFTEARSNKIGVLYLSGVTPSPTGMIPTPTPNVTSTPTCQDAAFIAVSGSGQHYTSDTELSISPQLKRVYNAMMSRLAGHKSVLVHVLNYPALSVNVLKTNLNTGSLSTRWHQFFGVNLPMYLAGKDKGVAALWGAVTQVRFSCPNQKIVLAGYSQGAMVVHEFLEELTTGNDTATKSAIRGVVLIADPERVKHSQVLEFGTAAWNEYGICNIPGLSRFTSCTGPLQLTDVPAAFLPVATDVCFQYDIACDIGELFHDFNVNTRSGYVEAINLGTFIHTGLYQGSPKTTTAGYRVANLLLASG
jgi:streptogramin lyase